MTRQTEGRGRNRDTTDGPDLMYLWSVDRSLFVTTDFESRRRVSLLREVSGVDPVRLPRQGKRFYSITPSRVIVSFYKFVKIFDD